MNPNIFLRIRLGVWGRTQTNLPWIGIGLFLLFFTLAGFENNLVCRSQRLTVPLHVYFSHTTIPLCALHGRPIERRIHSWKTTNRHGKSIVHDIACTFHHFCAGMARSGPQTTQPNSVYWSKILLYTWHHVWYKVCQQSATMHVGRVECTRLLLTQYLSALNDEDGPNFIILLTRWRIRWVFCFCNNTGMFRFIAWTNSMHKVFHSSASDGLKKLQYAILKTWKQININMHNNIKYMQVELPYNHHLGRGIIWMHTSGTIPWNPVQQKTGSIGKHYHTTSYWNQMCWMLRCEPKFLSSSEDSFQALQS